MVATSPRKSISMRKDENILIPDLKKYDSNAYPEEEKTLLIYFKKLAIEEVCASLLRTEQG